MEIKQVLKKYGVTQTELAKRMGMHRESLNRALAEDNDPRLSTLEKIAEALGCPVAELLKEEKSNEVSITCPHCGKRILLDVGQG